MAADKQTCNNSNIHYCFSIAVWIMGCGASNKVAPCPTPSDNIDGPRASGQLSLVPEPTRKKRPKPFGRTNKVGPEKLKYSDQEREHGLSDRASQHQIHVETPGPGQSGTERTEPPIVTKPPLTVSPGESRPETPPRVSSPGTTGPSPINPLTTEPLIHTLVPAAASIPLTAETAEPSGLSRMEPPAPPGAGPSGQSLTETPLSKQSKENRTERSGQSETVKQPEQLQLVGAQKITTEDGAEVAARPCVAGPPESDVTEDTKKRTPPPVAPKPPQKPQKMSAGESTTVQELDEANSAPKNEQVLTTDIDTSHCVTPSQIKAGLKFNPLASVLATLPPSSNQPEVVRDDIAAEAPLKVTQNSTLPSEPDVPQLIGPSKEEQGVSFDEPPHLEALLTTPTKDRVKPPPNRQPQTHRQVNKGDSTTV